MRQWYHSVLGGSWKKMGKPHERSPLAQVGQRLKPGEVYEDGLGNSYKYEEEDDGYQS